MIPWKVLIPLVLFELSAESALKVYANNQDHKFLILGMALYTTASYFLSSLIKEKGLAIGNALAQVGGLITITLWAMLYFKEKIDLSGSIGLALAFLSVLFLTHKELGLEKLGIF